jgi:hypothetical protein
MLVPDLSRRRRASSAVLATRYVPSPTCSQTTRNTRTRREKGKKERNKGEEGKKKQPTNIPTPIHPVSKPYLLLPFDLTNTLFYLGGLAALTVFMGQLVVCWTFVCYAAQADVAASAASFAIWSASAFLTVKDMIKERKAKGARSSAGRGEMVGEKEVV